MMVSNQGTLLGLVRWQGQRVGIFAGNAALVGVLHELHHWFDLPMLVELPHLPVSVLGAAIGIFVSFRSNAGYDRWWEGRKLWGRLVNVSRHWGTQALVWIPDRAVAERLVRRHLAYVHVLRAVLRGEDPLRDPDCLTWLTEDEQRALPRWTSPCHALLHAQAVEVAALADAHRLDEMRLQGFHQSLDALLDVQGGCERIKRTPVPRGYAFIGGQLIMLYSVLLPFALVDSLLWFTIPVNVLICLSFSLIGETGRVLEDPFTMFWNGLPLSALSRTIERDLRDRLGDSDLPPPLQPDHEGILM